MKLSDSEQRAINQWKKRKRRWLKLRWLILIVSAVGFVFHAAAIIWFNNWAFLGPGIDDPAGLVEPDAIARIAILASHSPILWVGFLCSVYVFGFT